LRRKKQLSFLHRKLRCSGASVLLGTHYYIDWRWRKFTIWWQRAAVVVSLTRSFSHAFVLVTDRAPESQESSDPALRQTTALSSLKTQHWLQAYWRSALSWCGRIPRKKPFWDYRHWRWRLRHSATPLSATSRHGVTSQKPWIFKIPKSVSNIKMQSSAAIL
jgi:hypothetical protein